MTQILFGLIFYLTHLVAGWSGYQHHYTPTSHHQEVHSLSATGQGKKHRLVMLHGMGSQSVDLYPIMQPLRSQVKSVTAVDLAAHGLTSIKIQERSLPDIQQEFFGALHTLIQQNKEPVVLWGNSLGGWTAINYASQYPEDVKALILVSPAGAKENAAQSAHLSKIFLDYSQHAPHKMVPLLFNKPPADSQLLGSLLGARFSTPNLKALMPKLRPLETIIPPERLAQLPMPVLLIWGKNDRIFPEEVQYFKQPLQSTAKNTVIEPTHFTHSPYIEGHMAQELSDLMVEWLKTLRL